MAQKKRIKNERIIIYALLAIIAVLFIMLFSLRAFQELVGFRENKNYFRGDGDIVIEEWMNGQTILRHFNITESELLKEFNSTEKDFNFRVPLEDVCRKKHLGCEDIVKRLNEKAG